MTRITATIISLAAMLLLAANATAAPAGPPAAPPEKVGMSAERLSQIDRVVAEGLKDHCMPGCVVMVCRQGKTVFLRAYGDRQVSPTRIPMTTDTVFDLASLTKPVATATSVMLLVERGKLKLDDPVAKTLPEFGRNGKEKITVLQLLTHQGGLVADNSLSDYDDGPAKAREKLLALKPIAAPGERFIYSDVGFMVLGELVRRAAGKDPAEFARENIYRPLGMSETGYLPDEPLRKRAAPTERRGGQWMQGEVHDPRAFQVGGVAGHAGLFSTAADLAVFAQMLLGDGEYRGTKVLSRESVAEMTKSRKVPHGLRGLGWDVKSGYSSNRSPAYSDRAFGHGGFTGTSLWIDPQRELVVIFLSNRLHPDGKGSVNRLAARIGTIAVEAIGESPTKGPAVLTGIDVLQRDGFSPLAGRRVGLITNHTGVNRQGVATAQLLRQAPGVQIVALFSPEHGPEGKLDAKVADARDPLTGLPVYSLYGKTRKPTAEMLKGVDTLVFDIQDIGARFYTYISTMGHAMQAAAEHKLRFVVLDRPNPINGRDVAGPVLDAGRESFVGFHRLPVRHGMTVGELARMFNGELRLDLDLHVVRMEGWRREMFHDATGLRWINPSPNMRSLTEAILYPGIGLLETTNLSVGRGTATPFEVLGAPWLDGPRLAAALADARLPGVSVTAITFTPEASKFQGRRCQGIRLTITDRAAFEPLRTGLEIARQLRKLHPSEWDAKAYNALLGNKQVHEAVLAGKTVAAIEAIYGPELQEFLRKRAGYLMYGP
jgi:uncharacterized protein YbbC (DUF1343 family)